MLLKRFKYNGDVRDTQHKTITKERNVNVEEDILIIQNIINISLYKVIEVGEQVKVKNLFILYIYSIYNV